MLNPVLDLFLNQSFLQATEIKKPPKRLFILDELNHLYNLLTLNVQHVTMARYNPMVAQRP